MITKYPWFGPKHGFGWGWTPITWEGWAVTAIFCVVIAGSFLIFGQSIKTIWVTLGAAAGLVLVCQLTGTAPG
jgi:hypothetical protein